MLSAAPSRNVCYRRKSGKHLLILRSSRFDPGAEVADQDDPSRVEAPTYPEASTDPVRPAAISRSAGARGTSDFAPIVIFFWTCIRFIPSAAKDVSSGLVRVKS
jgi:hypothetical protein